MKTIFRIAQTELRLFFYSDSLADPDHFCFSGRNGIL